MPGQSEIVDLDYDELIFETMKAYQIKFPDHEPRWVPISLAEIDRDARIITVPVWWADQEELQ